jgi:hypothetical protein
MMWSEVGERALVGPALIKEAEERVAEIREKLKAAQSRQKSYSDKKRREVTINPGDFVYLKVSPIRGTRRFQVHGKLAPWYIGPYRVQKKIGAVAYRLELPEGMIDIHPVFHVSQLRRCLRVPEKECVLEEEIALQTDLRYQEVPIKILDTVTKRTRNSEVRICRVQWSRHGVEEATWMAYHPQTDGQTERVNQIVEDMLRECVLTYGKDWEQSLPYAEFSYNNGYQASLGMSPFEALYGRKCRTPLVWSEVGERALVGPALIKEAEERVTKIREKLKAAQSRQKSYSDKKR